MPTEVRPVDTYPVTDTAKGSLGLIRIVSLIVAHKRLVAGAGIAGGIIAGVISLLLPNTYTATAVIMPPQKEQSTATMLLGQLGPLAAVAGADLGLKNPADLYVGLLGSRTVADHIISKYDLKGLYRTKTDTDTRARLRKHAQFKAGRDSLIRIEVEDTDPTRAAAMANMFVSELDEQNKRLAVTEASERRRFLEEQLRQSKSLLATAEDAMKATQLKTGMIEVSGQTHVAIASMAQLRAQITAGEVALARMEMGATAENPVVVQAQTELAAMRLQLAKLEKSPGDGGPLVATSAIPEAGLGYIRRLRDLKYHEFLFELLSKQYEAARIDESKAAPPLQIVDPAVPPDKKSGPPRTVIATLGCLAGLGGAILILGLQSARSTSGRSVVARNNSQPS